LLFLKPLIGARFRVRKVEQIEQDIQQIVSEIKSLENEQLILDGKIKRYYEDRIKMEKLLYILKEKYIKSCLYYINGILDEHYIRLMQIVREIDRYISAGSFFVPRYGEVTPQSTKEERFLREFTKSLYEQEMMVNDQLKRYIDLLEKELKEQDFGPIFMPVLSKLRRRREETAQLLEHIKKFTETFVEIFDKPKIQDAVIRVIRGASKELLIMCPYISKEAIEELLSQAEPNLSIKIIVGRKRSANNIVRAVEEKLSKKLRIAVKYCSNLHCKIIANESMAFITSANLTREGLSRLQEIGILIRDLDVLAQIRAFFEAFWSGKHYKEKALTDRHRSMSSCLFISSFKNLSDIEGFWRNLLGAAKEEVILISPYITTNVIKKIISLIPSNVKVTMLTKVDPRDWKSGQTEPEAVELLLRNEHDVWHIPRLHAKGIIIDNKAAIISSLNLTHEGFKVAHEAGLLIINWSVIKDVREAVNRMKKRGRRININEFKEIKEKSGITKIKEITLILSPTPPLPDNVEKIKPPDRPKPEINGRVRKIRRTREKIQVKLDHRRLVIQHPYFTGRKSVKIENIKITNKHIIVQIYDKEREEMYAIVTPKPDRRLLEISSRIIYVSAEEPEIMRHYGIVRKILKEYVVPSLEDLVDLCSERGWRTAYWRDVEDILIRICIQDEDENIVRKAKLLLNKWYKKHPERVRPYEIKVLLRTNP